MHLVLLHHMLMHVKQLVDLLLHLTLVTTPAQLVRLRCGLMHHGILVVLESALEGSTEIGLVGARFCHCPILHSRHAC